MENGVTFDIIDHVDRRLGRYPESLMKIQHDLAEKKLFPGRGWGWEMFFLLFERSVYDDKE